MRSPIPPTSCPSARRAKADGFVRHGDAPWHAFCLPAGVAALRLDGIRPTDAGNPELFEAIELSGERRCQANAGGGGGGGAPWSASPAKSVELADLVAALREGSLDKLVKGDAVRGCACTSAWPSRCNGDNASGNLQPKTDNLQQECTGGVQPGGVQARARRARALGWACAGAYALAVAQDARSLGGATADQVASRFAHEARA